jgi:2-methylisocitrate lyase-like PEP mutase family enzyme
MSTQIQMAERFLALHRQQQPLLLPNPWDLGSAKLLPGSASALATTSGVRGDRGPPDGKVRRDEALAHAAAIVEATDLPVSADLENGFADHPAGVAETVHLAAGAGLAGCSVEDFTGSPGDPIYEPSLAAERVTAAAEVAASGPIRLVLTARAENYLHGRPDLADTIARLQAYQEAGADVLYAPGLTDLADIREVVTSVDCPVNVLALPAGRRYPNWPRPACGGSRSALCSPSPRSERWSRPPPNCASREPTASAPSAPSAAPPCARPSPADARAVAGRHPGGGPR